MSRQLFIAPGYESVAKVFGKYHKDELAGASFAATVNGAQVVDLWGGAKSDGTPWNNDTLCVIASGTKGICAVAVLMCVERGLINLEAPIESVWPEFAAGGKGHVLIGDALAHMAGVPGIERKITAEEISDPIVMAQLLAEQHLGTDVSYSEQGMQGDTFVSLDCGSEFIKSFQNLLVVEL